LTNSVAFFSSAVGVGSVGLNSFFSGLTPEKLRKWRRISYSIDCEKQQSASFGIVLVFLAQLVSAHDWLKTCNKTKKCPEVVTKLGEGHVFDPTSNIEGSVLDLIPVV